jgi:hypothetical protein
MVGEIFLARLNISEPQTESFWESTKAMESFAHNLPGFVGLSVWKDMNVPNSYVAIMESKNEASAMEIMSKFIESPIFDQLQGPLEGTSSNRWIKICAWRGEAISKQPPGSYLSASLRTSDPGRSDELAQDYDLVFGNLSLISGYSGHAYGSVNQIEEQMIGLVWWNSIEAYKSSLPPQKFYQIRLFCRVSETDMHSPEV